MEFLNPKKIFDQVPLQNSIVAADFGAGSGFFSFELAKRIGKGGTVYAIDILGTALEAIRSRASSYSFENIKTVRADLELEKGSTLDDASCDLVIVSNILFQVADPAKLLKEARRALKNNGMLVLIEWIPEKMPSTEGVMPLAKGETERIAEAAGFEITDDLDAGAYHYGFLCKKPA